MTLSNFLKLVFAVSIVAIPNIIHASPKSDCILQEIKDREYITIYVCPLDPDPPTCVALNEERSKAQIKFCNTLEG